MKPFMSIQFMCLSEFHKSKLPARKRPSKNRTAYIDNFSFLGTANFNTAKVGQQSLI